MNFLEKNLRILSGVDKTLARRMERVRVSRPFEVCPARDGNLTLKADGLLFHSNYEPRREAEQQVRRFLEEGSADQPVLVLGLGLGYHVEKVLKATTRPVVLVEPDPEVFRLALERVDLERVLVNCRHLCVGKPVDRVVADLEEASFPLHACRVFVHQPSMRLNRGYFDRFAMKVKVKHLLKTLKLNILVMPPIYGGSLPVARYCVNAFRKLGHRATRLDSSIFDTPLKDIDRITSDAHHRSQLRGSLTRYLSERAMAKCLEEKPDIVFALAQAPLTADVLERMRQFDILTVFWFVEDFRELTYWREVAARYDHFFAIQKREAFEEEGSLKDVRFHYLPLACDPGVHKTLVLNQMDRTRFGSQVSFVGAGYHNRQIFFQGLLDCDFKIWGTAWNLGSPIGRLVQKGGKRVTPREAVKIFNGSQININLHSSTYQQGINPHGDFVNPRTFEIASCGAFQLVDPRSHLSELFRPEQEIICFESIQDLREKIAYYLDHPEERRNMALKSQERAHRDHTYERRATRMLEIIVENHVSRFMTLKERVQTPEHLITEAGPETELGQFLSRFKGEDHITLETIVSRIHQGKGKLTEPEIIFLLMNEFSKYTGERRQDR
jgi:spore maturation protein CgeB